MAKEIYSENVIKEILEKNKEYTFINLFKEGKVRYMNIIHNICGKEYSVRIDKFFSAGQRCSCLRKREASAIKDSKDFQLFLDEEYGKEYTLVSEYLGRKKSIRLKHNCGFEYSVKRAEFLIDKNGGVCPVCIAGTHNDTDIIKERLARKHRDIELIEIYKGINEDHLILNKKCSHQYSVNLNDLLNKEEQHCPICDKYSKRIEYDRVKKEIETGKDLILLSSEYHDTHDHLEVLCKKCSHRYLVSRTNILSGKGCPFCAGIISNEEKEVLKFIKEIYKNTINENKKFSNNRKKYELDIYLPDRNIGFEFDGLYWHSDVKKDKDYHINKTKFFKDLGIRVVHIFEDEWLNKQEIVKTKIKNILGVSNLKKIGARKINVKEITNDEKTVFLEKYHIQGADHAVIKLGGFFNGELVAVMTFSKLRNVLGSKIKKDGEYELSRYATSKNIAGGFSKMLKYAADKFNMSYIKTFADLRWSDFSDNVYSKNGFTLSHISSPNYFYIPSSEKIRYHRFNFRKQVLKEKFPEFYEDDLTEFQIMDKTQYTRIWDCGNLVYELKIEKDKL